MELLTLFKQIKPELLIKIFHNALIIAILLLLGKLAHILLKKGVKKLEQKKALSQPLVTLSYILGRWSILILLSLLILAQLGFSISNIWTMISAILAMIAVGFIALWSVLSNMLCTLLLLIFQPFQIGDEIEIMEPTSTTGLKGRVVNLNMIYTILEQDLGLIHIPNHMFFQKSIRTFKGTVTVDLKEQLFTKDSMLPKQKPSLQKKTRNQKGV